MNILFTAFSISKGLGGHTRSMKQIMGEIGETHNCFSLIFGPSKNVSLINNSVDLYIDVRNDNYFKIRKKIKHFILTNEIELVHSFDDFSYFLSQLGNNIPHLLTRCGGPNPKKYPVVNFLTCFSKENYEYFKTKSQYKNSSIFLIPNRVKNFNCNLNLINDLELIINKNSNDLILLRIARIGSDYFQSIQQSINLLKKYQKENNQVDRKIKLIVLGSIYEKQVYEKLVKENIDVKNLYFITDKKYTQEAKTIIDIADIIIGTGRGFMEASSRGKILFAPVKGAELPMLINTSNFDNFFHHNFSERTEISQKEYVNFDLNEITNSYTSLSFPENLYDKYFNIENGIPHYLEIYKKIIKLGARGININKLISYLLYSKYLIYKYGAK